MPIIRGVKMACEPCIRGHRSTKCNHANERLMVSVRKPGRPLSVCPHPPSNPCSCSNVTAAIPRSRKCGCGSKPNGKTAKTSPTRKASHPPPTPGSGSGRSRFDPSALERTDPTQVNIHPAPAIWNGSETSAPGGMQTTGTQASNAYILPTGAMTYATQTQGEVPAMYTPAASPYLNGYEAQSRVDTGMYGNQNGQFNTYFGSSMDMSLTLGQLPQSGDSLGNVDLNMGQQGGTDRMLSFGAVPLPATPADRPKRSCCSGTQTPADSPGHTPNSSLTSLGSTIGTAASTFSASTPMSSSYSSQQLMMKSKSSNGNGIPAQEQAPGSGPMLMGASSVYGNYTDANRTPAWYRYDPGYGTMATPLQPSQWPAGLTVLAAGSAPFSGALSYGDGPTLAAPAVAGEEHMCACGDDCECIGCVAHPYNHATQSTVQAAWTTMMDDALSPCCSSKPLAVSASAERTVTTAATAATAATARTATTAAAEAVVPPQELSPQQSHTPSDTSGAAEDQVSLPADDFFFVSYSVMGCSGEELTCPCGEDCQCVGCAIHNNPRTTGEGAG